MKQNKRWRVTIEFLGVEWRQVVFEITYSGNVSFIYAYKFAAGTSNHHYL